MIVAAPYPNIQHLIVLPEPLLSNKEQTYSQRQYQVTMNKSIYSHVKRPDELQYVYNFQLTRNVYEQLTEFIRLHAADVWQWIDHHNETRIGYCINEPYDSTIDLGYFSTCNEKITATLVLETCEL